MTRLSLAIILAAGAATIEQIKREYGETLVAAGNSGATFMALVANASTGTWSIFEIFGDGSLCIRGVGDGFHAAKQGAPS